MAVAARHRQARRGHPRHAADHPEHGRVHRPRDGGEEARRDRLRGAAQGGVAERAEHAFVPPAPVAKLDDVDAAVFGAGIYDFKKAHDEATIEGIRRNMEFETGWTEAAIQERSSVFMMNKLKCPVLILHGEKDENVPVTQAYLLRDRLTELKKEFEIKLFPDRPHGIGPEVTTMTVDFFKRHLLQANKN